MVQNLVVPYPDFRLGDIIDPDQFDANNQYVELKVNEIVAFLNNVLSENGASEIGVVPTAPFTSEKLQQYLDEVIARLTSATGAEFIGATPGVENTGSNIQSQLNYINNILVGQFVTTNKIVDGSITNPKLANESVTNNKLGPGAVTGLKVANSAIGNQHLTENSITTDKVLNGSITNPKLAFNSVTDLNLNQEAVTPRAIQPGAVQTSKIADRAVTSSKIGIRQVLAEHLDPALMDVVPIAGINARVTTLEDEVDVAQFKIQMLEDAELNFATNAEAIAGVVNNKVTSPASIKSFTDANTLSRRGAITNSANFNNLIEPGAFFINQPNSQSANFPAGANPVGTLVVISSTGTGRVVQQYFASDGIVHTRSRIDNAWGVWTNSNSASDGAIKKSLTEDYLNAVDKTLKVNKLSPVVQPSGNYAMTVQNNKDNPNENGLFVGGRYADHTTRLFDVSVLFGSDGAGVYPAFLVDASRQTKVFGKLLINDSMDVENEINSLKSSVSNGKTLVSAAISDKGVYTSAVETFQNMANNIRLIAPKSYTYVHTISPNSQTNTTYQNRNGSSVSVSTIPINISTLGFIPSTIIIRGDSFENTTTWTSSYYYQDPPFNTIYWNCNAGFLGNQIQSAALRVPFTNGTMNIPYSYISEGYSRTVQITIKE